MKKFNNGHLAVLIIVLILVIDQVIKILVKTNMCLHESIEVTPWFYINFIENNGMAYGMTFINKFVLSLFRVVAVAVLGYYIWLEVKKKARTGYIICVSMVLAGAAGNILDSMFYGLVFNASSPSYVSYFVPFGEGYAPFLTLPDWLPIWGGRPYVFFSPVFNFADASITCGVILLLLFFRKELSAISFKRTPVQSDSDDENHS